MAVVDPDKVVFDALEQAGLLRHVDVDQQLFSAFVDDLEIDTPQVFENVNEVPERFVQYVTHKLSDEQTSHSAHCYRLYVGHDLPPKYTELVKQWNCKELAKMELITQPPDWLQSFAPFMSRSETEVALMYRYVQQRNAFFEQHSMLTADEVINVLGLAKKNARRTVRDLSNKHQLILFKHENKLSAPAFQFTAKGLVYPAIIQVLPKVIEQGIQPLEFAMWLVQKTSALLNTNTSQINTKGMGFEQVLQQAEQANQTAKHYHGKPIEALAEGNNEVFLALVHRWLYPDTFNLSSTEYVKDKKYKTQG